MCPVPTLFRLQPLDSSRSEVQPLWKLVTGGPLLLLSPEPQERSLLLEVVLSDGPPAPCQPQRGTQRTFDDTRWHGPVEASRCLRWC